MAKKRTKRTRVARRTARKRVSSSPARVALSHQERDLLREACRRYRSDLPTYLAAARTEWGIIEEILKKI